MIKYIVNANMSNGQDIEHQDLDVIKTSNGRLYTNMNIPRGKPLLKKGDAIKVYRTNYTFRPIDVAYSYKINGKRYVDLLQQPNTHFAEKTFYNLLGFWDAFRLNLDIAQVLRQRDINPSFNRVTNLKLFLREHQR